MSRGFALTEVLAVIAAIAIILGVVAFGGFSTAHLQDEDEDEGALFHSANELFRAPVLALSTTPDGGKVVTGGQDSVIRVWDIITGQPFARLHEQASPVRALAVSPNGKDLVTASGIGTITVWRDFQDVCEAERINMHRETIRCVAYSPSGDQIVSGGDDGTVSIWNASTLKREGMFRGHSADVRCVAFTPNGLYLLSGSRDGSLKCWNVKDRTELWSSGPDANGSAEHIAISSDGQTYLAGAGNNAVLLGDMNTGSEIQRYYGHAGEIKGVVFLGDGRQFASCSSDQTVRIWDVATAREVDALRGRQGAVNAICAIQGGRKLLSSGRDCTLRVWDRDLHSEPIKFEPF